MRIRLFRCIHFLVSHHPRWIVLLSFSAAALAGWYGVEHMEMIADQDQLISERLDYHRRYLDFIDRFGDLEFLYIVIESKNEQETIAFADALSARLKQCADVGDVIYAFDTAWIKDAALYYASLDDLKRLDNELDQHRDDLRDLYSVSHIDEILDRMTNELRVSTSRTKIATEEIEEDLSILLDALQNRRDDSFESFSELEDELAQVKWGEKKYNWSTGKRFLIMLVMPAKDYATLSVIEEPLNRIRTDIWLTQQDFPNVQVGLTGRPALQADEMRTTNNDMLRASLLALVAVLLLFVIFFRELIRPFLAVIALLTAMGWTYGFVALTLGHLNLLSLVFALVLIGLGVDFGIHYLHRYQEELDQTRNPAGGIWNALQGVGSGIITGALTSSVAFLLALLTDFRGLAELGYVAGVGILFCLVAMLLTLSALLVTYDRHLRKGNSIPTPVHLLGLRHVSRYPRLTVICFLVLTIALLPYAFRVRFDDNLLKLQADGLESVTYERLLIDQADHSTWYCAFLEPSYEEMLKTVETLKKIPSVAHVDSLDDVLPNMTKTKQGLIDSASKTLFSFPINKRYHYLPNPKIYGDLTKRLDTLFAQIELLKSGIEQFKNAEEELKKMESMIPSNINESASIDPQSIPPEYAGMAEQYPNSAALNASEMAKNADVEIVSATELVNQRKELEEKLEELNDAPLDQLKELNRLLSGPHGEVEARLQNANSILFEQPRASLRSLAKLLSEPKPTPSSVPSAFKKIFVGKDNSLLVMAYPKENIWNTERMREFVSDMRAVDPNVTGVPIQVYESSLLMRDAFIKIGILSFIVVAILVMLDFLSLKSLFYVLFPLALAVLWLVEIMGLLDVHLNLANFFAIPILIGIGVDDAVHFVHRFNECKDVDKSLYTTGTTLTLTTLTTVAGFGSLIFASHKGLASLGILMALGSGICWFASVVFLPTLLKMIYRNQSE